MLLATVSMTSRCKFPVLKKSPFLFLFRIVVFYSQKGFFKLIFFAGYVLLPWNRAFCSWLEDSSRCDIFLVLFYFAVPSIVMKTCQWFLFYDYNLEFSWRVRLHFLGGNCTSCCTVCRNGWRIVSRLWKNNPLQCEKKKLVIFFFFFAIKISRLC